MMISNSHITTAYSLARYSQPQLIKEICDYLFYFHLYSVPVPKTLI
ncbi:MAG: hypothetical protein BWZ00_00314 [Bacteroidetes bacterium ADurb.BinA174]|nr:MAG: hypothetical protein BWZ00_00314 [Bacteroidetes bacterium ADurb.BinA174]